MMRTAIMTPPNWKTEIGYSPCSLNHRQTTSEPPPPSLNDCRRHTNATPALSVPRELTPHVRRIFQTTSESTVRCSRKSHSMSCQTRSRGTTPLNSFREKNRPAAKIYPLSPVEQKELDVF